MSDSLAETVCRDIDAAREELIGLCGRLVAATSVNPPGRTAEAAEVVRAYLSGHGVATETITADDEAPNVIGRIEGGEAIQPMTRCLRWLAASASKPRRFSQNGHDGLIPATAE